MKALRRVAVLLLLALLVSGSYSILHADTTPAERPQITPGANAWGPAPQPVNRSDIPGGSIAQPATPAGQSVDMGSIPEERIARYYVPPIPYVKHESLLPRQVTPKDFYLNVVDVAEHNRMIVKFTEESMVRWSNGRAYSKRGYSTAKLDAFLAAHPEVKMRREMDEIPEATLDYYEANGERNTGQDLANLNNFYVLDIATNEAPMKLIGEVIDIDLVETAFYQPHGTVATCTDIAPMTSNWVYGQDYHDPAPLGVDAAYSGSYHPSGRGHYGAWTVDIEWDWTETHEDFNQEAPNAYGFEVLYAPDGGGTADHGDACSGIIGACNNSYGMEGESYNVTPKAISVAWRTWASAISLAQGALYAGESMFIEIHAGGPDPGYGCDAGCGNCGQFRYIAIEYWDDNFNAIQTATANNRLVYEAGGNGQMNLDNAIYGNRFQTWFRNSNAIMVAATVPSTQVAECWSSYGSRLDLNGWGESVWTLGYGDWMSTGDRRQFYTSGFSGTSSATPIVTAAGNCLQGISQDKYGITLTPANMRSYLRATGTPYSGSHIAGPRPNLAGAINWIEPDVAPYTASGWSAGFVPRTTADANATYAPLPASLPGNSNGTYLNFSGYNWGYSPAPDASNSQVYSQLFIDGVWVWWVNWTPNIGALTPFSSTNWGPITVAGGRHSTQWYLDPNDAFNEYSEANNAITQQFVWSPLQLTAFHATALRSAPPLKLWGNPTYANGDGFRGTGAASTWWLGFAVLPQAGNDVDAYSYPDTYSSTSGFDNWEAGSARGSGASDLILVNGNVVGSAPSRLFQAIRYSDASTSDYAAEVDASSSDSWYPPFTRSTGLGSNEVMDLFEIYLAAGTPYLVSATGLSNNLDLTLAIYGQGTSYFSFYDYDWISNSQGPNGSEGIYFTPTESGWYCAAVIKSGSESYLVSGAYTFHFEANPAAYIPQVYDLVAQPWSTSNQIRLTWSHVNADNNGIPLSGRNYTIYRNANPSFAPSASDSIGTSSDSTWIDYNATAARNFYQVRARSF